MSEKVEDVVRTFIREKAFEKGTSISAPALVDYLKLRSIDVALALEKIAKDKDAPIKTKYLFVDDSDEVYTLTGETLDTFLNTGKLWHPYTGDEVPCAGKEVVLSYETTKDFPRPEGPKLSRKFIDVLKGYKFVTNYHTRTMAILDAAVDLVDAMEGRSTETREISEAKARLKTLFDGANKAVEMKPGT